VGEPWRYVLATATHKVIVHQTKPFSTSNPFDQQALDVANILTQRGAGYDLIVAADTVGNMIGRFTVMPNV